MNNKTKELVTLYKDTTKLLKERLEIDNKINSLYVDIESKKQALSFKKDELNSKIGNSKLDIEQRFIKVFKYIFAIGITLLIGLNIYNSRKGIEAIAMSLTYSVICFFLFRFIGKYVAILIYKLFGSKINNLFTKKYKKQNTILNNADERIKDENRRTKEKIKELEGEREKIQEEINKIDLGDLHKDYHNLYALSSFVEYFERGRCDNLKECINLFEKEKQENERNKQINELQQQMQKIDYRIDNVKEEIGNVKGQIGEVNTELGSMKKDIKDVNSKASKSLDLAETEAKMKTDEIGYEYGKEKLREINRKNYKQ